MSTDDLSKKVYLDTTSFKTGAAEMARDIRIVESEFKAAAAGMENWSHSATGLEARIKALTAEINIQQQKVAAARAEYERLSAEGKTSKISLDNMQIAINKETAALNGMQLELGQSKTALNNMSNGADNLADKQTRAAKTTVSLSGTMTELNAAINVAQQAVQVVGQVYEQTLGQIITYDAQVRKMSDTMGIGAEETSRLIQMADDLGMETDNMARQMAMAVKNGFIPSIDNLAKLADTYVSISDPLERATTLTKIFGKNWTEIVPVLKQGGQAIRDGAAAIDENLVRTNEQIKATREYEKALDDLNDAFTAFKIKIFGDAIPALTTLLTATNKIGAAFEEHSRDVLMASNSFADYTREMERARDESNPFSEVTMTALHRGFDQLAEKATIASVADYDLARSIANGKNSVAWNTEDLIGRMQRLNPVVDEATKAALQLAEAERIDAAAKAEQATATEQAAQRMEGYKAAIDGLTGAEADVAQAEANWITGVGSGIAGMLDEKTLGAEKYHQALKDIDTVMGTNLAPQDALRDAQAKLVKEFQAGKLSSDEFKTKLQELKNSFMPLDDSIKKVNEKLQTMKDLYDQFVSKEIELKVIVTYDDGTSAYDRNTPKPKTQPGISPPPPTMLKATGMPTLPTVNSDTINELRDKIDLMQKRTRTVGVTQLVESRSNSESNPVTVYATVNNGIDVVKLAYDVAEIINRRR